MHTWYTRQRSTTAMTQKIHPNEKKIIFQYYLIYHLFSQSCSMCACYIRAMFVVKFFFWCVALAFVFGSVFVSVAFDWSQKSFFKVSGFLCATSFRRHYDIVVKETVRKEQRKTQTQKDIRELTRILI